MITLMIFFGVVGVNTGADIKEVLKKNMLSYVLFKANTAFLFIIFSFFGKIFSDGSARWLRHGSEVINEGQSVIT